MSSIAEMVPVHYANRSGRGDAASFVLRDVAREMVEAGLAVWGKGCKFINLKKTEAQLTPIGISARMPAWVGQRAVEEGDSVCIAAVNAWA